MKLTTLDWTIIAAYMLMSLAVGLYMSRRASVSMEQFFVSGRNLPWWLAGTSMVATTFSSDTPLYITGLVRGHGIYENWQWWCFMFSGMLSVAFFARFWRRSGVLTDVELINIRYSGRSAKLLRGFKSVYFSCIIHTIIKAQVILAMVKILDVTLGWGKWESVILSSVITLVYATMAGFWGVVITDLLQFVIATVGAIVLAVVAVDRVGGIGSLKAALPPDTLSFFPPGEFMGTAFMAFLGYIGLSWWSKYSSDGGGIIVQRISSCRSEREGYIAAFYFNVMNYAVRTWPWVLAALASLVLYKNAADNESVYATMVVDLLPSGLTGLMLASFFAAFMSTISSYLNLSSAYFVNDFYKPFMKPSQSEEHYVAVSRLMTIVLSVVTAIVTYYVSSIIGVFKFLIAFGSGTGLVYIVRWFWWRVNAWSEISAMLASTVMTIVMYKLYPDVPYYGKLASIISVSTAIWVATTFITKPVDINRLVDFVVRVRPEGPGWERIRREARALGHEAQGDGLSGQFIDFISGSLLIMGLTIGLGKLLLGYWLSAFVWGALAMSAWVVLKRRIDVMSKL